MSTAQSITEIVKKIERLKLPVVTKAISNGSSVGISIIKEYDELQNGINYAGSFDQRGTY